MPDYTMTFNESRKYREKVLFSRKKADTRKAVASRVFALVDYNPIKKLQKQLVKIEKAYEIARELYPVRAARLLRTAVSVTHKMRVSGNVA